MMARGAEPLPALAQVQEGVWAIPVPIPDNPLKHVVSYALELDGGGLLLVDTGWAAEEAMTALVAALAELGAGLRDVRGVAVTHIHPDHYGLAGRIREISGAWIALHPAEAALIATRYGDVDELVREVAEWLGGTGAPADEIDGLATSSLELRKFVDVALPDLLLEDGDAVPAPGWDLVCLHTPGHTAGHLCFHERGRGFVLTGDHVLPRITPNIAVHPQSGPDPLGAYLAALDRLRPLGDLPAFPSHEHAIERLGPRLDELLAHHEAQLERTRELVAAGAATTWEVARGFSWSRPWPQITGYMRRAALGEAQAHLVVLERRGLLRRVSDRPIRWFVR